MTGIISSISRFIAGPSIADNRTKLAELRSTWRGHNVEVTAAINEVTEAMKCRRGAIVPREQAHYQDVATRAYQAAARIIRDNAGFWRPHVSLSGPKSLERCKEEAENHDLDMKKAALLSDVFNLTRKAEILLNDVGITSIDHLCAARSGIEASVEIPRLISNLRDGLPVLGAAKVIKFAAERLEQHSSRQNVMSLTPRRAYPHLTERAGQEEEPGSPSVGFPVRSVSRALLAASPRSPEAASPRLESAGLRSPFESSRTRRLGLNLPHTSIDSPLPDTSDSSLDGRASAPRERRRAIYEASTDSSSELAGTDTSRSDDSARDSVGSPVAPEHISLRGLPSFDEK